jgi:thiol:disulfide interchange protein DsbA
MKRLIGRFLCVVLLVPVLGQAAFVEGQHYQAVPFPQPVETGNKIEVREFFWYGCPHCYVLEPALTKWLKKIPSNAKFIRTPGTAPAWMNHAQAFYAFESMGITSKMHEVFFKAVQEQKAALNDENSIANYVASQNVAKQKFLDAYHSFGVRLKLEKAKQLNQDFGISSVPTIVVDGKYLTSEAMAGGEEAVFQLVNELIAKAAKERQKKQ